MAIPPPPAGFFLVNSGPQRPILRKNPQPSPQTPAQAGKDVQDLRNAQLSGQKTQLEIDKARREAAKNQATSAFREPVDKILNVIDAAATTHRMTRQGGLSSDPWGREIGKHIPGTGPKDIAGFLDTIGGNTAFETLSQMRQESPTGGAVGNVSDKDLQLLRSTIASLDPGQSTEKFQRDLATVVKSYQKVLYKLPGGKEAYHNWRESWLGRGKQKPQQNQQQQAGGFEFLGFEQ